MSDIRFACPHCSQHIVCDAGYRDLTIDCPACGKPMVVPRLSASDSEHPAMVVVASTPTPPRSPAQPLRAWTEQEWAGLSRQDPGRADAEAPHWVIAVVGTLILAFIFRIHRASFFVVAAVIVLGAVVSGMLLAKGRSSSGAYSILTGLGYAMVILIVLPIAALSILFIGCVACK